MEKYSLFNEYVEDKMTYSVDMVTFRLVSLYSACEYLLKQVHNFILSNFSKIDYEYKYSFLPFRYAHFYQVTCGSSVIKIWIGWNDGSRVNFKNGRIQFNPNKVCNDSLFLKLWEFIKNCCLEVCLRFWDFALDVKCDREEVKLHKDGRKYQYIKSNSITESLGVHGQSGFFKIYDKGKTSDYCGNLTRCELTVENIHNYEEFLSKFPKIDFFVKQLDIKSSLELNQNDFTFLRLLIASDDFDYYYNQLTYRKREKFRPYLFNEDERIVPSRHGYQHCCDFVFSFLKFRSFRSSSFSLPSDDSKQVTKHYKLKKTPEFFYVKTKPLTVEEVQKEFNW